MEYQKPAVETIRDDEFEEILASAVCQSKFACGSVYS